MTRNGRGERAERRRQRVERERRRANVRGRRARVRRRCDMALAAIGCAMLATAGVVLGSLQLGHVDQVEVFPAAPAVLRSSTVVRVQTGTVPVDLRARNSNDQV